ncbi:ASCH domain-containing protein [Candidatus Pacearchaeota archaeon]|nr:ASCH domain-containing protein [Candidatus Pacearchaeota archaeon]
MNEEQKDFLFSYLDGLSEEDRKKYTSFSTDCFCADEKNANICSELIRSGVKTAGCSMKYWYESGLEPMPTVGHLQVVTDWHGEPTSIIEIVSVSECKFSDVSEEFAAAEGEGDKSLNWWREAHWDFFSKECEELGMEASESMDLVLERFKVVYSLT